MANARSIPVEFEASILQRWVAGHSVREIADWITATNKHRVKPIETSPSSIERMIARHEVGSQRASVATLHRLRRRAPAQVEILDAVQAEYLRLAKEADTLGADGTPLDVIRARCLERSRNLRQAEMCAVRTIRVAGLAGRDGQRVLDANVEVTAASVEQLEAEAKIDALRDRWDEKLAESVGGVDEKGHVEAPIAQQKPSPQAPAAVEVPTSQPAENAPRLDAPIPTKSSPIEAGSATVFSFPVRDSGSPAPATPTGDLERRHPLGRAPARAMP